MTTTPEHAARIVDGRTVVDELPCRLGVLPGEVDLVAQHLADALGALFGDRPYTSECSAIMTEGDWLRGSEEAATKTGDPTP